jgi:Ca2+-binding RTX toxin-like protein
MSHRPCSELCAPLEPRTLLSASVTLIGGVLRVNADDDPDTIVVGYADAARTQVAVHLGADPEQLFSAGQVARLRIAGGGGDDTINIDESRAAFRVRTFVDAGAGNDTVTTGGEKDQIYGRAGLDSVHGGAGGDVIAGGDDNDQLDGGEGSDLILGGDGDDALAGDKGNDVLLGGAGDDTATGGAGNDLLMGMAGDDSLDGGDGNDVLFGGDGSDAILGGDGNDNLIANAGPDTLDGGAGRDYLVGSPQEDSIVSSAGKDRVKRHERWSKTEFLHRKQRRALKLADLAGEL